MSDDLKINSTNPAPKDGPLSSSLEGQNTVTPKK